MGAEGQHIDQPDAHVAPARLHRRRLHRCHRPRQHAGAPRHADRAADRRARRGRADAGDAAGGGGGAEVAHHPGRAMRSASRWPRSPGCARRAPARSCSNTARPSIPPSAAISARSARRCSTRSAPISRSPARRCRRTAAASIRATCSSATSCLSDTHMRHHPLTPMTDSNLVAVLQRQSRAPVGLLPYAVVDQGPAAIRARLAELRRAGHPPGDRRCAERAPPDRSRRRPRPSSR